MGRFYKSVSMDYVKETWENSVIPTLEKYIEIPNQSPVFDAEWDTNGYQEQVVKLFEDWVNKQPISGFSMKVVKDEGCTPLIFAEVKSTLEGETEEQAKSNTILMYGHFDKQPPLADQWEEGLHPYKPVKRDGKLYGRGGADDGYAFFCAITALCALQKEKIPHPRCVIVIEGCEESGSMNLMNYIRGLSDEIGTPSLVVCLDSGSGNYEQMFLTTSLRGLVAATLRVDILKEGCHSGKASGIVPDSMRIMRMLLSRLEDENTGDIICQDFHVDIPPQRKEQILQAAENMGKRIVTDFPLVDGADRTEPVGELLLNNTWKPALAITGVEGIPALANAGNVLRSYTTLTLSLRIPPTLSAEEAGDKLKALLEKDPPYGAKVTCNVFKAGSGWNSPPLDDWLMQSINDASQEMYDKPCLLFGEGASIPFMGMLGVYYPNAQFVVTGVLGPNSNAHGPNEFLHMDYSRRLTGCIARILQAYGAHKK